MHVPAAVSLHIAGVCCGSGICCGVLSQRSVLHGADLPPVCVRQYSLACLYRVPVRRVRPSQAVAYFACGQPAARYCLFARAGYGEDLGVDGGKPGSSGGSGVQRKRYQPCRGEQSTAVVGRKAADGEGEDSPAEAARGDDEVRLHDCIRGFVLALPNKSMNACLQCRRCQLKSVQ